MWCCSRQDRGRLGEEDRGTKALHEAVNPRDSGGFVILSREVGEGSKVALMTLSALRESSGHGHVTGLERGRGSRDPLPAQE